MTVRGLLFHGLVDARAVLVVHLVELVDEADAGVRKYQRAALQHPLARLPVLHHRRGQANSARAFAGCEHRPRERSDPKLPCLCVKICRGHPRRENVSKLSDITAASCLCLTARRALQHDE